MEGAGLLVFMTGGGGGGGAEFSVLSSVMLFQAVKCGWSHMQVKGGKLVMWPETDIGSELPLVHCQPLWLGTCQS